MAEGLRLIGSCPRCDGELVFAEPPPAHAPADTPEQVAASTDSLAPHMVLGVPRGW